MNGQQVPDLRAMSKSNTMDTDPNYYVLEEDYLKVNKIMMQNMYEVGVRNLSDRDKMVLYRRLDNQMVVKEMMSDIRESVRAEIDNNPERFYGTGEFKHVADLVRERVGSGSCSRYMFFVINVQPSSQDNIDGIQKAIVKAGSKVWVKRYLYSFEQRGTIGSTDFGTGLHCNLLVEKKESRINKKASECKKEMRNTFKHLIGKHEAHFVQRYAPEVENFFNYINGIKVDADKMDQVIADREWRKINGWPATDGNWDSLALD